MYLVMTSVCAPWMLVQLDLGAPARSAPNFSPGRAETKEIGRSGDFLYLMFFLVGRAVSHF